MARHQGHGESDAAAGGTVSRGGAMIGAVILAIAGLTQANDGDDLYFPCRACHWEDGTGSEALNAPAIIGLDAEYLTRQMRHFRDGRRGHKLVDLPGRTMSLMAASYDDESLERLGRYVATLRTVAPERTLDGDPRAGESIWRRCAVCHGDAGEGNGTLGAPALIYQQDWYFVRQLRLYREGLRGSSPGDIEGATMRASTVGLTDRDFHNLAAYLGETG